MSTWIAVLGVGLGSFALRFAPMVLGARVTESDAVQRSADLAGTAALAALVATALRFHSTGAGPGELVAVAAATAVGAALAHRGRPMPVVLIAGMAAYWAAYWAAHLPLSPIS